MGFFSKILDKLDMGDDKPSNTTTTRTMSPASHLTGAGMGSGVALAPRPVAVVDVVAQLEARAHATTQKLNWRTSIVDLLKLLDLDSNLDARKELARELNCPPKLMTDSAKMNMWLHQTVLQRIAENGGNVPPSLLN